MHPATKLYRTISATPSALYTYKQLFPVSASSDAVADPVSDPASLPSSEMGSSSSLRCSGDTEVLVVPIPVPGRSGIRDR